MRWMLIILAALAAIAAAAGYLAWTSGSQTAMLVAVVATGACFFIGAAHVASLAGDLLESLTFGPLRVRDDRGTRIEVRSEHLNEAMVEVDQVDLRQAYRRAYTWRRIALMTFAGLLAIGGTAAVFYALYLLGVSHLVTLAAVVVLVLVPYGRVMQVFVADLTLDAMKRIGHCAVCGYRLTGLPRSSDGCTVCPECGGAWRIVDANSSQPDE